MNKKERINFCESLMTHAMVYTGYNTDPYGAVNYWKIENSWGTVGELMDLISGSLVCSDGFRWFRDIYFYILYLGLLRKYKPLSLCFCKLVPQTTIGD